MIFVIGSINLDLTATVARLPQQGETVPGTAFRTAPGGKGANQAVAVARAGAAVRMIGCVGEDAFAAEALSIMAGSGVDVSAVSAVPAATGTALILVDGAGENVIAFVAGANDNVSPEMVAQSGLGQGDFVLLQQEVPMATVASALAEARRAGATSILNTAPVRAEAAAMLGDADVVIANETEFALYRERLGLAGSDRDAAMLAFAARFGKTLVVTLGGDGVVAAVGDRLLHRPAPKIEPVDTVGAGDTFCGYLAAALSHGLALEPALVRAAAAASLACLKPGAQPAIPRAAEVAAAITLG